MEIYSNFRRGFKARANSVEAGRAFERLSLPVYLLVGGAFTLECAIILATDFTISPNDFVKGFYAAVWLVVSGLIAKRYKFRRIGEILETLGLCGIIGAITAVYTVLASSVAGPFEDEVLIAADRAMGMNWLSLLSVYKQYPWLIEPSSLAYKSLFAQFCIMPIALFGFNKSYQGWLFINAYAVAALLTVLVFPFFPAKGPYIYYGLPRDVLPNLIWDWPWEFGPRIEAIRSGHLRDINAAMMGLVSFPSFHAAAGILFAWAAWSLRILRWPFVALNLAMIFSTIIRGSHYFIDVVGGMLLAVVAIAAANALCRALSQGLTNLAMPDPVQAENELTI